MEKFNLAKALNGAPVILVNGLKAYVKYRLSNPASKFEELQGFFIDNEGLERSICWDKNGIAKDNFIKSWLDVFGMWSDERKTEDKMITIEVAQPILTAKTGDVVFYVTNLKIAKLDFDERIMGHKELLRNRALFATYAGAESWQQIKEKVILGV